MSGWLSALLRRARLRGLREGLVQTVRVEALENEAHDDAERWQDYGLASNPVDGQGLKITVGGHTIVLRMDRLAERPQLAAYEVAVWHREGHRVTLRAGRLVEVECDDLVVRASNSVTLDTPTVTCTGAASAATSLKVGGTELAHHKHGGVSFGSSQTAELP